MTAPPTVIAVAARRKRTPLLIAGLSVAAVVISATYWLLHRNVESTDDAQVEGRVMTVAARVSGQVLRVGVEDNQRVEAGEVLVELDPAEFAARFDAAKADVAAARAAADGARSALALTEKAAPANLMQARGGLISAASSMASAQAAIEQAKADLAAARSRKTLAEQNLVRARTLVNARIGAQALLRAFNTNFLLLGLAFLAASWLIVFMRRPQRGAAVEAGAH
jgi:membrane fusion protein (multidrug efflux system)